MLLFYFAIILLLPILTLSSMSSELDFIIDHCSTILFHPLVYLLLLYFFHQRFLVHQFSLSNVPYSRRLDPESYIMAFEGTFECHGVLYLIIIQWLHFLFHFEFWGGAADPNYPEKLMKKIA
ncbi:unnamed protein product [Caenorhabditis brenneri]